MLDFFCCYSTLYLSVDDKIKKQEVKGMSEKSIANRRTEALYKYVQCSHVGKQKDVLRFVMAILTNSQIKEVVEYFNIEVKK